MHCFQGLFCLGINNLKNELFAHRFTYVFKYWYLILKKWYVSLVKFLYNKTIKFLMDIIFLENNAFCNLFFYESGLPEKYINLLGIIFSPHQQATNTPTPIFAFKYPYFISIFPH